MQKSNFLMQHKQLGVFFLIRSSNNCFSVTKCERWVSQGSVETLFR